MRGAGRGRIVNVSSIAGRVAVPGGGVYHMTKHALEAMADALRPEVKKFGINVVNVLPGPFVSRYREKGAATIPHGNADGPYAIYKRNIDRYLQNDSGPGCVRSHVRRIRGQGGGQSRHRRAPEHALLCRVARKVSPNSSSLRSRPASGRLYEAANPRLLTRAGLGVTGPKPPPRT